jgi:intradiol ring-cleaving dioxygenase-like protein
MRLRPMLAVFAGTPLLLCIVAATTEHQPRATPSWEVALAPAGEPGDPFVIEGRVMSSRTGHPMRDVLIHTYHQDHSGNYNRPGETHPRLEGVLRTNVLGQFRIRTVLPGGAEGGPHVHFDLGAPDGSYRAAVLNLCRGEGAGHDTAFERLPYMLQLPDPSWWVHVRRDAQGAFHCRWDLSFAGAGRLEERPEAFDRPKR